ncbi:MAG: hypothetical protein GQ536_03430 [Candidatus Aminicenantes bacterium]|nr:hypothetical protein [Candidatus Aminicenantes bacterium]
MGRLITKNENCILGKIVSRFSMALNMWEKGEIDDKEFSLKLRKIEALLNLLQWFIMIIGVEESKMLWESNELESFIQEI